jgi:hypothetical protein
MRFSILPPAHNLRGPVYTESLLRLVHQANRTREPLELHQHTDHGEVGLSLEVPDELRSLVREGFLDGYPGTTIMTAPKEPAGAGELWTTELRFSPDVCACRRYVSFHDAAQGAFADPLAVVFSALRTGRSGRLECRMRLRVVPARPRRVYQAERSLRLAEGHVSSERWRRWYLAATTNPRWLPRRLADLFICVLAQGRHSPTDGEPLTGKLAEPLFECRLTVEVRGPREARAVSLRKLREIGGAFGVFSSPDGTFLAGRQRHGRSRRWGRGFLLTPAEIATLWHPLVESERGVARLQTNEFRELEPPVRLPSAAHEHGVTTLGRVRFRQQRDPFGIRLDDLQRHLLAIGKTGCGKSTFLANVVRQQIERDRGVVLIDPHGQLADEVLEYVPQRRTNDVIVFEAGDAGRPVGFNPLRGPPGSDPTLIADGVLTAFENVFGFDESSAPRLLHIFRNALLALIGRPEASLLAVQRLLVDAPYRKTVTGQVRNPVVRSFWEMEFHRWHERDRVQYIASLQNKLGAFTTNERLQAILGATEQGIDLRSILDCSQILICNLSKGTVGSDASRLLGALLLSSLHVAAFSRADTPEDERADAVVVVDEFHSYLSEGNATLSEALAEARKYRTSYVLATQLLEQLDSRTRAGVLGNCGSVLTMTVGPQDAAVLAELLGAGLSPDDLLQIPKHHGYLRLLVDGAPHSFSMTTLPPPRLPVGRADVVRRVSRERYGRRPAARV